MAKTETAQRSSGILMHPTSLPGPGGIGSLGAAAKAFVDSLAASGQQIWQLLPMVPTGSGDSPYSGTSAFGNEPMLIDLQWLVDKHWLTAQALAGDVPPASDRIDFAAVRSYKYPRLRRAFETFQTQAVAADKAALATYAAAQAGWLPDFALYTALKDVHNGLAWSDWEPALVSRKPEALSAWRDKLAQDVAFHVFCQFVFDRQWRELRAHATHVGVRVLGDIPIFVAYDSADVWAHQELFHLDAKGQPTSVSGVPPD
ncbi:MAG: 4-alpha-glucanotransferase, partial [Candidatus Sericytochromatia bacterium]|nr:4-alpha-glucanotransferase [Candidatus Sericytochromatia bacterium]